MVTLWRNLGSLRDISIKKFSDLEFDLSRSLNVKSNITIRLSINDFLLMSNGNHMHISRSLAIMGNLAGFKIAYFWLRSFRSPFALAVVCVYVAVEIQMKTRPHRPCVLTTVFVDVLHENILFYFIYFFLYQWVGTYFVLRVARSYEDYFIQYSV